jgi:hypothetical protein
MSLRREPTLLRKILPERSCERLEHSLNIAGVSRAAGNEGADVNGRENGRNKEIWGYRTLNPSEFQEI